MQNILRPDNHTLWLRVQHLVSLRWNWEEIAIAVEVEDCRDLVQWVLDYKGPKKKPLIRTAQVNTPTPKKVLLASTSAQFIAWRKQREGALKALEAAQS